MDRLLPLNLDKICRACLKEHKYMTKLFLNKTIKMFTACTTIKLEINDELPQLICTTCLGQIKQFYAFKISCLDADEVLHQRLRELKTQQIKQEILENIQLSQQLGIIGIDAVDDDPLETQPIDVLNIDAYEIEVKPQRITGRLHRNNIKVEEPSPEEVDDNLQENRQVEVIADFELSEDPLEIDLTEEVDSLEQDKEVDVEILDPLETEPEIVNGYEQQDPLETEETPQSNLQHKEMEIIEIEEVLESKGKEVEVNNKKRKRTTKVNKDESFSCTICQKVFLKRSYLLKHMRRHPEYAKERFKCMKCKTEYTNVKDLNNHFKTHGSSKNAVNCPKCNQKFYNTNRLQLHFNSHIGEEDTTCTICLKIFPCPEDLKLHFQIHLKEKPFTCDICGQSFKTPFSFKLHMKRHNEEFTHTCEVCNKGFMEKRYLERHMRTHTQEKIFFCEKCDRGFSERSDLTIHLRIHSGVRPFKCPQCELPCQSSSRLHTHMKSHSEERPYICKVCSKSFKLASALIRHILTHPGQEPYKCNQCDKRFTKSTHLKQHKMKHWKDNQCDKTTQHEN